MQQMSSTGTVKALVSGLFLLLSSGLLIGCEEASQADSAQVPQTAIKALEGTGKQSTEAEDTVVTMFRAQGNEPFWTVELAEHEMRFITPEHLDGIELKVDERLAYAKGVTYSGLYEGQEFWLDIRSQPCQDTMVERDYEFTATFHWAGEDLLGCASRWDE
ncbi:hypothetical protein HX099_07925 [Thiopseudomonas alkaliphila]|uniref:Lipoprotein n=1 Tax=Thiopseudomonas alkaliphila TaxID=1697053 RepID=A0AAW7DSK4_9GAMM|nr:hypothetical protein [Thiopseudomonas alkaliphila]MDM1696586.1 hypothetical protein [Thiopseudomonas alkaliphila]